MKDKRHILILAFLASFFVSCDKDNVSEHKDSSGAAPYTEQDWNWDKQLGGGFSIDTAWDGGRQPDVDYFGVFYQKFLRNTLWWRSEIILGMVSEKRQTSNVGGVYGE